METVIIREYEFTVAPFTAYESIKLGAELAGLMSKVIKHYEPGNLMSIINGLDFLTPEQLVQLVKKITTKTRYKKEPIDLDSSAWGKTRLFILFELCWEIIQLEYSALFEESGLGELMKPEEAVEEDIA